jgi:hypothetical protein
MTEAAQILEELRAVRSELADIKARIGGSTAKSVDATLDSAVRKAPRPEALAKAAARRRRRGYR